jgi:hypothetical protein
VKRVVEKSWKTCEKCVIRSTIFELVRRKIRKTHKKSDLFPLSPSPQQRTKANNDEIRKLDINESDEVEKVNPNRFILSCNSENIFHRLN